MRYYQFSCTDCGAVGPRSLRASPAHRIAAGHQCDSVCAAGCGRKDVGHGTRGLCRACYADLDIRLQFGISFHRGADLIEDAEWLADDDATLTQVLARLDVKNDAFWKACSRAGRLDLHARLADREPNGEMRQKARASHKARSAAA